MGKSEDLLLGVLAVGALGIGAIVVLPKLLEGGGVDTIINGGGDEVETVIPKDMRLKRTDVQILIDDYVENTPEFDRLSKKQKRKLIDLLLRKYELATSPEVDLIDVVRHLKPNEKAFVITEGDFDALDIGKKEKRLLKKYRQLTPDNAAKVVYGLDLASSNYVNSVSPFGIGKHQEFARIPQSEQTSSNTDRNTINLYEDN